MRFLRLSALSALLFTLYSLAIALPAVAQENQAGSIELAAEAGFDGIYKGEFWVPVRLTVANNGPDVEARAVVAVESGAGSQDVIYSSPISLPNQSNKRLTLYVHLPNLTNDLTVQLFDEADHSLSAVETNTLDRLAVDDLFYGAVTSQPGRLDVLEDVHGDRGNAAVAYLDVTDLPEVGAPWNALDVLVFSDVDTGRLTEAQLTALKQWLSTGGQLVVTGGPNWQQTAAALADMLPVTVTGVRAVEALPILYEHTGLAFRDPGPYLVAESSLRSGELLFHQDGLPLLARQDFGRGSVYFLALDPGLAPLADWTGSEQLWGEIATVAPRLPTWAVGAKNGYAAGTAVSSLPSLALPSALQLFLFMFVYVAVVGPLNYIVLKRMNRRELAWLTIPGLVLLFSASAYLIGFRLKGNEVIINQMSIAFGSTDSEQLRVQSLLGLYSPRRATYDVTLPGGTMVRPFDRNSGDLSGGGNVDAIERGSAVTLRDVRVDVSGVETFVADSYQLAPAVTGQAVLRRDGVDFVLDITVQNNGGALLEDTSLLVGQTAIPLGELKPGDIRNRTQPISSGLMSAAAGIGSGASITPVPSPPSASPLSANYTTILGTSDYYNDPQVFPRYQLLESIGSQYGTADGWFPRGVATLVAWSDEGQLETVLDGEKLESTATTLYFLELPLVQSVVNGPSVTLPRELLDWQVLGESGIYDPGISNLYLPPGWVEFEFQPWPEFQTMAVTEIQVELVKSGGGSSQPPPRLQLWDWREELWVTLEDATWGRTTVGESASFMGPGNAVRIRLQNNGTQGIDVREIYPILTGDLG